MERLDINVSRNAKKIVTAGIAESNTPQKYTGISTARDIADSYL